MTKKALSLLLILFNAMLLLIVLFHDQLSIPVGLQVTGRMHPMLLHLPIGFLIQALAFRWLKERLQFKGAEKFIEYSFVVTAIVTSLSALAGCFLAAEEGYSEEIADWHMYSGTALSLLTLTLCYTQTNNKLFTPIGATSLILLVLTGHFGSELTHGENFVTGPLRKQLENPIVLSDSSTVFEASVMPLLDKKCTSCHNPGKKKGGLDMTSWEALTLGGESGPIWIPGDPSKSELIKRMQLPLEHDDHMPPAGKQQLTDKEKKLLHYFIQGGASKEIMLGQTEGRDSLETLAHEIALTFLQKSQMPVKKLNPVSAEVIGNLNTIYRNVSRLATEEPGLRVGFFMASGFNKNALEELNSVSDNILELYLSGMPVDKVSLSPIKNFSNLEVLFLNNTSLDDAAVETLLDLSSLKKISVSNTKITAKGLRTLAQVKSLREISAWSTAASTEELNTLASATPGIEWHLGEPPAQNETLQLTAPLLVNDNRILKPGEKIIFKHNLPGVTIRYSLKEQSEPDSVHGEIYKGPITPGYFTKIKLKAVKEGWRMSPTAEASFFTSGMKPLSGKLLLPTAKDYRGNGIATLTDARPGDQDNHRDGQWLGYRENAMSAVFEFNENQTPGTVIISYLKSTGSYILPPQIIRVYAGDSETTLKLLSEKKPKQPEGYDRNEVIGESIELEKSYRFIRITAEPVEKLPTWHSGKGQRGWIFIDEVFFYPKPTI